MAYVFRLALAATLSIPFPWQLSSAYASDARDVFGQIAPSVVVLETLDETGASLGAHSAIVVGSGFAVSTCDVMDGAYRLILRAGTTSSEAKVVARDRQRNLCKLAVRDFVMPATPLDLSDTLPSTGRRVYAVSNALGLGIGISEGVVSGIRDFAGERYIQFSAPVSPGSEGGALVDATGRLVGVIDYRHRDGQNVNFAAPVHWIAELGTSNDDDEALQELRSRAARLERQRNWPELMALSRDWVERQRDSVDAWRWLALAANMTKDLAAEELAWREMRRIDPLRIASGVGLARTLLERGQAKESLELARSLLAIRQEDAEVWLAIGNAEQRLGKLGEAEHAFRKTISLWPWAIAAHKGLIAIAETRGDSATVATALSRVAHIFPDSLPLQGALIRSLVMDKRPGRALSIVERLIRSNPENGDVWHWQGLVLDALGRPGDAIQALRRSLEKSPSTPAAVWAALGAVNLSLQSYPEAVHGYREAVKLAPGEFFWRFQLAVALKDGGYLAEAIALDEKMVAERPDDASVWRQLGFASFKARQMTNAIKALERSLDIDPNQGKTWVALLESYHAEGRKEDLKRGYDKLRDIDSVWAEHAYKRLVFPYEEKN